MKRFNKQWIVGWILLTCVGALNLVSQEAQHSTYYYQKKSLFKLLPNNPEEIIFLGDSITDGCEWAELFKNVKIINRGISGDTTNGVLERLDEVIESRPAAVFLMIGINDLARERSVKYILDNLGKIIRKIGKMSPGTTLYVQGLLPVSSKFHQFPAYTNKTREILAINKGLENFCRRSDVVYINLYSSFVTEDDRLDSAYTNDGLHLSGKGYLLWKSLIDRFINMDH
jgi:lysophospholipase L1-like esterase